MVTGTVPEIIYGPLKGELYASVRCPSCRAVGWIDRDQYEGRISIVCPAEGCGYHETHDLGTSLRRQAVS